ADPVLKFSVSEIVAPGTSLHKADDGTIFYYKYRKPERLYVKSGEEEIDLKMQDGNVITEIGGKTVSGNSIYFMENGKIYKADFSLPINFNAVLIRDSIEGEVISHGGICSRVREGKKVVYRLSDDHERDQVTIDVHPEQLEGYELRGVHRGRAIYLNTLSARQPSACKLSDSVLAIQCILGSTPFMRDSSRLIYLTNQHCVFVLDCENALFMPLLSCGAYPIRLIASVIGNVITVRGRKDEVNDCLMTAELPNRYVR
ncbi:hypothetical protein PMAYCL1PPCAC_08232, partial [Pristionchus mayeri]